jgi:hypothetical protein
MRRTLLALVLLLAAAPLAAYTIYLKDGTTLNAREKYTVSGKKALVVLPGGAQTTLPLDQIDVKRTDEANATNFGDTQVVKGGGGSAGELVDKFVAEAVNTPAKQANLSQFAGQRHVQAPAAVVRPTPNVPVPAPTVAKVVEPSRAIDFLREPRVPASNAVIAGAVGDALRSHGVTRAGIYDGSQPHRLLIDVSANSEGGVFQAIGAAAQAILEVETKHPGALEALELFVATDNRQRAGQFLITPERAQELVGRKLDLAAFYLKYVEF